MRAILLSVGTLLISAALLLSGGGLLSTLIAVRANLEGFSVVSIGLLSSGYFAGFITGCILTPTLVKRVGHVRVFAAFSGIVAAATLTHILVVNVYGWFALRLICGFAIAGLYMLIESWINEQAPNDKRGKVLSVYRMVDLTAITVGQYMLSLADPGEFQLFAIVAILISLAIFPISLSTSKAPAAVSQTKLDLKKLTRMSPMAVAGCFSIGMSNGAFWAIAPVFVQQLDYNILMVSTFMSVVIVGGAIMQWPIGSLSDKFGRRGVMIIMSALAAFSGIFLWQFAGAGSEMLLVGGVLYGMTAMQIFGLSAAHANDRAEPHEFIAVSGGLFLIYGVGSMFGPILGSFFMSGLGPSALFAYTSIINILLCIFGVYRVGKSDSPDGRVKYVRMPRARSFLLARRLDPRHQKRKRPSVRRWPLPHKRGETPKPNKKA